MGKGLKLCIFITYLWIFMFLVLQTFILILSSMHKILNKFLAIFQFYSLIYFMKSLTLYNKLHSNQVKVS
jgi:hypothetical protein